MDTLNTNQHYVAQMLLRGFAITADSEQVHVFDKQTGNIFKTTVRNIAAERGYYDMGDSAALDAAMNRADKLASNIITEIRNRRSLAGTTYKDRAMLAGFVALQMIRTRGFQENFRHLGPAMIEAMRKRGLEPPAEWDGQFATQEQREAYLKVIPGFMKDFLPHLLKKDLLLFKTDPNVPFCISDNPVALHNTINDGGGVRGTLGLAVRGIEIYMPISTELTLAFMCPTIGMGLELVKSNMNLMGGFINENAFYYLHARDVGKALMIKPDNVRFQNSLQILNAERFVISSREDFADAADIVRENPEARVGLRVRTS
jgi:hypothetical protein